MAIRIEDTRHIKTTLSGHTWVAGAVPHELRMRLMKQHVGWNSSLAGAAQYSLSIFYVLHVNHYIYVMIRYG